MQRWGWRAYALPILTVVTVAAIVQPAGGARGEPERPAVRAAHKQAPVTTSASRPPEASATTTLKVDDGGRVSHAEALRAAALPSGPAYTRQGSGQFAAVPGTSPLIGSGGPVQRYRVTVEQGVDDVDRTAFGRQVQDTLSGPNSWAAHSEAQLQRTAGGRVDFTVALTSAYTVRSLCGYEIPVETSCWNSTRRLVVINVARWTRGSVSYIADLAAYRIYAINHEVGHALGHGHAHGCLPGGLAPIMMQQTLGLYAAPSGMCGANPWPYPPGVRGAPGHEEPDTPANSEYELSE